MHEEGLNTEAGMIRLLPGARQQVLRESERAKVAYVSANCVFIRTTSETRLVGFWLIFVCLWRVWLLKVNGSLFAVVLERAGVCAEHVLHIENDIIADVRKRRLFAYNPCCIQTAL